MVMVPVAPRTPLIPFQCDRTDQSLLRSPHLPATHGDFPHVAQPSQLDLPHAHALPGPNTRTMYQPRVGPSPLGHVTPDVVFTNPFLSTSDPFVQPYPLFHNVIPLHILALPGANDPHVLSQAQQLLACYMVAFRMNSLMPFPTLETTDTEALVRPIQEVFLGPVPTQHQIGTHHHLYGAPNIPIGRRQSGQTVPLSARISTATNKGAKLIHHSRMSYKTTPCKHWTQNPGWCPLGDRCCFIHDDSLTWIPEPIVNVSPRSLSARSTDSGARSSSSSLTLIDPESRAGSQKSAHCWAYVQSMCRTPDCLYSHPADITPYIKYTPCLTWPACARGLSCPLKHPLNGGTIVPSVRPHHTQDVVPLASTLPSAKPQSAVSNFPDVIFPRIDDTVYFPLPPPKVEDIWSPPVLARIRVSVPYDPTSEAAKASVIPPRPKTSAQTQAFNLSDDIESFWSPAPPVCVRLAAPPADAYSSSSAPDTGISAIWTHDTRRPSIPVLPARAVHPDIVGSPRGRRMSTVSPHRDPVTEPGKDQCHEPKQMNRTVQIRPGQMMDERHSHNGGAVLSSVVQPSRQRRNTLLQVPIPSRK